MTKESLSALWEPVLLRIKGRVSADVFSRWIEVIRPLSWEKGKVVLGVPNDFYVLWLKENYLPLLQQCLLEERGKSEEVVFQVDSEPRPEPAPLEPPEPRAPRRKSTEARTAPALNPAFTFDNFVVGPSNTFAHVACMAVANKPAQAYNPLLIYGGSGLGKTHLMQAIGHAVYRTAHSARVCYVSAESFLNEFVDYVLNKTTNDFRRKYRGMDVLLLDDVHFLAGKTGIQEEFFHTFNALTNARKQIVLTCDRPIAEIVGLEPRLVSRFGWGLVTELSPPDLETRLAILRKKAAGMNITLPPEVMEFIAENFRTDIRKLEGALTRVVSYASLCRQPINVETVSRLLRDTVEKAARQISVDAIQKAVAETFDLRLADMTSKRRPQSVAFPRQVAMYLSRTLTPHSLPAIGEAFGRNHATVIHACRAVENRMRSDPAFRETIDALRERLQQP